MPESVAEITAGHVLKTVFRGLAGRIFIGMTPRTDHRYFLPLHGLAFEASWRVPVRRKGDWIRALVTGRRSPESSVSPTALLAAVELIEGQDIDAATAAFTSLGYDVRVRALR